MFAKFLDPKNDVAFKKIFGSEQHKSVLIHFLNDILDFRGKQKIEQVEFLKPSLDPEIAAKKQSIVDVLCRDARGVQYIIEMQVAKTKGFEQRAQYYAARAYGCQANQGDKYHNLKEVIFIAIADCIIFPNKTAYRSNHIILDEQTFEHDLRDFSFTFIELPKFNKKPGDILTGMVERWCYFFKYAPQTHEVDLKQIIGRHPILEQAYQALDKHYWSEGEYLAYEQELKRIRDERAILEQKLDDAWEEGRQKGIQEGMGKGEHKKSLEIAQRLRAKGLSIEEVQQLTGLAREALKPVIK